MTSPIQEPVSPVSSHRPAKKRASMGAGRWKEEAEATLLSTKAAIPLATAGNGIWVRITSFEGSQTLEQTLKGLGIGIGSCGKVVRPPTSNGSVLIELGGCSLVLGRKMVALIQVEILG